MRPGDIILVDFNGSCTPWSPMASRCSTGDLGQQRGMQVVRVNEMSIRKSGNALDALREEEPNDAGLTRNAPDVVPGHRRAAGAGSGPRRMTIRDLLTRWARGSVIELPRSAGDPAGCGR